MDRRNLYLKAAIAAIIILLAVLYTVSCASNQDVSSRALQIISHKMIVTEAGAQSSAVVNGRAQNTGTLAITSATITADFLDAQGGLIHKASTTRNNLAPEEIWEFAVETTSADAWKITKYTIIISETQ